VKFTQVHWFGKEFHTTVVTHKFAKITILLLQCSQYQECMEPAKLVRVHVTSCVRSKIHTSDGV